MKYVRWALQPSVNTTIQSSSLMFARAFGRKTRSPLRKIFVWGNITPSLQNTRSSLEMTFETFPQKEQIDNDGSQSPWNTTAGWMLTPFAKKATSTDRLLMYLIRPHGNTARILAAAATRVLFEEFRPRPGVNPVSSKLQTNDGLKIFRMRSTVVTYAKRWETEIEL